MRRLVGRHAVIRVLVVWVIMAVTLYVLSAFIPEIDFPGWGSAFAIAAVIGLLNAVVWPLFVRFALPITVLTLGVAALLLNGVIVSIASSIVDGFGVGVLWGIVATFILTVVNTVVTSLEDIVREACATDSIHMDEGGSNEAVGYLGASLTEAGSADNVVGRTIRAATKSKRVDGAVQLGEKSREETVRMREGAQDGQMPELSVMASGCLGLISFPREPGRLTLERIEHLYPELVPALRDHPGIGFMLVRSERHGAVAIGAQGTHYLDEDRVEGEDPLAPFGPNAARHVRRADRFEHVADVMVNSTYYAEMDEVAAFEELVGSHGGMGGSQSFPFVVLPAGWRLPEQSIVGPDNMHRHMRRWLADLGHEQYRDGAT